jgi:transposase InsO family protein
VGRVAPNTLDRNFRSKEPNKKWTTDVTQVMIKDERMYLSPILDMFNGEIITYTMTSRPDLKMVIDMVNNAMKKIPNHDGLILHCLSFFSITHRRSSNSIQIQHYPRCLL